MKERLARLEEELITGPSGNGNQGAAGDEVTPTRSSAKEEERPGVDNAPTPPSPGNSAIRQKVSTSTSGESPFWANDGVWNVDPSVGPSTMLASQDNGVVHAVGRGSPVVLHVHRHRRKTTRMMPL